MKLNQFKIIQFLLSSSVLIVSSLPAFAYQTINSLPLSFCLNSSNGYWGKQNQEINVGTGKFKSVLYMTPAKYGNNPAPAAMRCRLDPHSAASTLNLYFGMQNKLNLTTNRVSIFLDGNLVASQTLSSGERYGLDINLSQATHITIETGCTSSIESCGESVYFFESLE